MQILRVLARHNLLGALRGKKQWPLPKEVLSALTVAGSLMMFAPSDAGWHYKIGQAMVAVGVFSMIIISVNSMRRDRGRR